MGNRAPNQAKHFVVVCDTVPHCYHGGGGVTVYSAVRALRESGARVSVVALGPSLQNGSKSEDFHISHLTKDVGAHFEMLPKSSGLSDSRRNFLRKVFPSESDLLPAMKYRDLLAARLKTLNPDGVFAYHWDALASLYGNHQAPKLGLVGDPIHLPQLFRKELQGRYRSLSVASELKGSIRDVMRTPKQIKLMLNLLNDCDQSGAFAAHHAKMFRESGALGCEYYRTPTPDPFAEKSSSVSNMEKPKRLKIIHIGHLQGIATLSGVELLADEILPRLSQKLGNDGFEIHLVGGHFESIPEGLKKKLEHPAVKVRGQITPPDEEFLSSHIVLVPTPIELGIRVRIITAFSFGSCIVAHSANQKGIPELQHLQNAMLANTGEELAEHCLRVYSDAVLRQKLEANSRRTYEDFFSLASAGNAISAQLLKMTTELETISKVNI